MAPSGLVHAYTGDERNGVLFARVKSNGGVRVSKFDQWLAFVSSIEWWKPHLFTPSSRFDPWLGPVWCMHAHTMREMAENGVLFDGVESNRGVRASKLNSFLVFTCSIEWWKPHLFIPFCHLNTWFGPVWCMHAQAMREMAENGALLDGVESNGGVRASKLNSFLVFTCSIEWMVKTASLHSF